jgi:hypothetical protein
MCDCKGTCDATTRKTTVTWSPETFEYNIPVTDPIYVSVTVGNPPDALDQTVKADIDAYIQKTSGLSAPGPPPCKPEKDCLCYLSAPKFYQRTGTQVVSNDVVVQKSTGPVTCNYRATVTITVDIAVEEGICRERPPGMKENPWQHPEFPVAKKKSKKYY